MGNLLFFSTLLIVGLSTAVITQIFEIKKLRKKIEQGHEIENDEGDSVYVEFTDGDTQVVKGVRMISSGGAEITLRAPDGSIVAKINRELVRAVYDEHAVTAEEDE